MTANLELDVCYYNVKLSVWEPLIEPNLIQEGLYDPWTLKLQVMYGVNKTPQIWNGKDIRLLF